MAAPATYSPEDVVVLVSGVRITGFADGDDVISIERSEDAYTLLVGADGDAAAIKSANRSGSARLRLLQTSKSNAILTGLLKTQDAGILSPVPFVVKDLHGADLVLAEAAFPAGPPIATWGAGHNAREWRLALPSVDILLGGV